MKNEIDGECSTFACIHALVGKPEGKSYMEDQAVDERIILKCDLKEWFYLMQTEFCENDTETWVCQQQSPLIYSIIVVPGN
jgi:hypothetical protein